MMRMAFVFPATLLPLLAWSALDAAAQQKAMSDEELIANATSAAPEAVAQHAAVMAMDADGKMRTLREGTNNFTCMPDNPKSPGDDPMCLDQNGMEWAHAWMTNTAPPRARSASATCSRAARTRATRIPTRPGLRRARIGSTPGRT